MAFNKIILASLAVFVLSGFSVMAGGVGTVDTRIQQDVSAEEHSVYDYEDEDTEGPVFLSEEDPRAEVPLALLKQLSQ